MRNKIANVNTMQFKCNLSAISVREGAIFSILLESVAIKLEKKRLCHPYIVVFCEKHGGKTKTVAKIVERKGMRTVEKKELLVELWPNYECLYKTVLSSK